MMRCFTLIALVTLVGSASAMIAFAQTTEPATQPSVVIDRTTPRGAAKALRIAIEAGDETALRDLLFETDADQQKHNDALAGVVAASSRLSAAANTRFGASSDPIATKAFSLADLTGVDSAPMEEKGDVALITLPARDHPLTLRKGSDGAWRVDLLNFASATRDQLPQQLAMLHEFTTALNQLATDTRDGRFGSGADLKAAIQDRVHGTIARSMRHGQPATGHATTAPTTSPTSAPAR